MDAEHFTPDEPLRRPVDESIERYPSSWKVRRIVDKFFAILFPEFAYADAEPALSERSPSFASSLQARVQDFHDMLREQVHIALRHLSGPKISADAITHLVTGQMTTLRGILALDIDAAYRNDPAAQAPAEIALTYPGFLAVATYRLAHLLAESGVPMIPRMMTEYAHSRTGIDVHPGASIGRSFFIDHGTGVVIGQTAEIGDRVTMYQGVTLGARNFQHDENGVAVRGMKRHPTVEDDVVIYANATILGGETRIGARSVIGGNVCLTRSVPPDSIVTTGKPDLVIRQRRGQ